MPTQPPPALAEDPPAHGRDVPRRPRHGGRAPPEHRLRGGALPQHLRVLERGHRDLHDPGGRLHAPLRLLQREERPARPGRRRATSPRTWPRRWRASALVHAVITSVDRDDLPDGGAAPLRARWSRAIRERVPGCAVEVLTPDFKKKPGALDVGARRAVPRSSPTTSRPTPRLYRTVRPGSSYSRLAGAPGGRLPATRCGRPCSA